MAVEVNSNYFSPIQILDMILDKGEVISNEGQVKCCPDCTTLCGEEEVQVYVLASVETFLKYAEAFGCTQTAPVPAIGYEQTTTDSCDCCLHIFASVETELKLTEAYGTNPPNTDLNCSENFNSCVDLILSSLTITQVENLLQKGIVEYGSLSGSSQLCKIFNFAELSYQIDTFLETIYEVIDRILDKGLVVACYQDEIITASVETYLKWATSELGCTV